MSDSNPLGANKRFDEIITMMYINFSVTTHPYQNVVASDFHPEEIAHKVFLKVVYNAAFYYRKGLAVQIDAFRFKTLQKSFPQLKRANSDDKRNVNTTFINTSVFMNDICNSYNITRFELEEISRYLGD